MNKYSFNNEEPSTEVLTAQLQLVESLMANYFKPTDPIYMATIAQIEANRRNALKSTGPKTAEGKSAASRNALKHGLYTSTLLLPEENGEQFAALCAQYIDHFQPEGIEELNLVEEMIASKWKQARINLMEQGVFNKSRKWLRRNDKDNTMQVSAEHICMEVGADPEYEKAMARFSQMEARLKRDYHKAAKELHQLQKERNNQGQPDAQPPDAQPPAAEPPDAQPNAPLETASSPETVPAPAIPPTPAVLLKYPERRSNDVTPVTLDRGRTGPVDSGGNRSRS